MCHVSSAGGSAFNCSPSQLTEKEPVTANRHNGPMRRRHGSRDRGPPMGAELRAQVTRLKEPLRAGGCWADCGLRTNCLATELLLALLPRLLARTDSAPDCSRELLQTVIFTPRLALLLCTGHRHWSGLNLCNTSSQVRINTDIM